LAGNKIAGTEKLGTKNSFDLNIITNNVTRMTVRANGKVGIGTTNPNVKLQVTGGTPVALPSGGYIVTGPLNSENLAVDEKGFQARNNGAAAILQLNPLGGMVQTGGNSVRILRTVSGARFLEFVSTVTSQNDARMEHTSAGSYLYFSSSANDFASFTDLARFDLLSFPTYVLTVYGSALASTGVWTNSDAKLKKDINDFNGALDIVRQLKPRTYFYNREYKTMNFSSRKQYGFVAQELEEVLPELVQVSQQPVRTNAQGEREMEDVKAVNYSALIPILTKALQEQEQKLNAQEKKIEELTRLVNQLLSPSAMLDKSTTQASINNP
jgi:hypothetical protein